MHIVIPLLVGLSIGFVIGYFRATRKLPWD